MIYVDILINLRVFFMQKILGKRVEKSSEISEIVSKTHKFRDILTWWTIRKKRRSIGLSDALAKR